MGQEGSREVGRNGGEIFGFLQIQKCGGIILNGLFLVFMVLMWIGREVQCGEDLLGLYSWWNLPCCVGGDFNAVCFPFEQLGAENFTQGMQDFSDFISIHGLMDIPLEDGRYTWYNSMSGSRIEHFLFSPKWEDFYPNIYLKKWLFLSYHFPILLGSDKVQKGRSPFRFTKNVASSGWFCGEGKVLVGFLSFLWYS